MSFRKVMTAASIAIIIPLLLGAQAPPVRSPEVNADHTVTFRLRAPQATAVGLAGEVCKAARNG
jgi:hypothetical protein